MIKTMYSRNIAKKAKTTKEKAPNPRILEVIYNREIAHTTRLLNYKFKACTSTGGDTVSLDEFKGIIRSTRFLTPKEKNLLIRLQKSDKINYKELPEMLYNVRYEIASSELMETNLGDLPAEIMRQFKEADTNGNGMITIDTAELAMCRCKLLNLTPFQIYMCLGESECNPNCLLDYKAFVQKVVHKIDSEYRFKTMVWKCETELTQAKMDPERVLDHKSLAKLDNIELFRTFKRYDRNVSGKLLFHEYIQCLEEAPNVDISKSEIVTLALCADMNDAEKDGKIDYEEFMKHYVDSLNMIAFDLHLTGLWEVEARRLAEKVDLSDVGRRVE